MNEKEIPILLLTGYLGSGKTTLVNHILANRQGIRFAVIVNDLGEVNIDASLIQKKGVVGEKQNNLIALQNGCICCNLQNDLVEQLFGLLRMNCFDYIVIEASGICEPEPIAQTLCSIPQLGEAYTKYGISRLDAIVTVVDALRMQDELDYGNRLTRPYTGEENICQLVIQQLEFCNLILLNKANEIAPHRLEQVIGVIRSLQPRAEIIPCSHAQVNLDRLLHTKLFDYRTTAISAGWIQEMSHPKKVDENHTCHHEPGQCSHEKHEEGHAHTLEYGIQTFVYQARKPFDIGRFEEFLAHWPPQVIRAKGVCYFSNNRNVSCIFEQAGQQKQIAESGLWYAALPEGELEWHREREPEMFKDWDEKYGDRIQKIVFIGQDLKKAEICNRLDNCLTD